MMKRILITAGPVVSNRSPGLWAAGFAARLSKLAPGGPA